MVSQVVRLGKLEEPPFELVYTDEQRDVTDMEAIVRQASPNIIVLRTLDGEGDEAVPVQPVLRLQVSAEPRPEWLYVQAASNSDADLLAAARALAKAVMRPRG